MCDRAKWCIVDGPCAVHDRYPDLQPPQIGPLSAAPDCTKADRAYIKGVAVSGDRRTRGQ